jgi:hypothetical protein
MLRHLSVTLWRTRFYWLPGVLLSVGCVAALLITSASPRAVLFRYVF